MDGYLPLKLKRKELEDVSDDFSDFSISSPARKIRRLDAELPPIMEEEELEIPLLNTKQSIPKSNVGVVIDELPAMTENEERAIVLFRPMNTPLFQSPSGFSVSVNPDLISGFKNQIMGSNKSNTLKSAENDAEKQDKGLGASSESLAVIPWVPSQFPPSRAGVSQTQTESLDLMESDDMEAAAMDFEGNNVGVEQSPVDGISGSSEGLHQWQQQHCMLPLPQLNTSAPIVWFR